VERSKVVPRFVETAVLNPASILIAEHSYAQVINAVSIRHQRPFRAVTASDDASIVFFTGVPYKNDKVSRHAAVPDSLRTVTSSCSFVI
jgi:hypothetical protein